jgi:uncharacterized protein YqeY
MQDQIKSGIKAAMIAKDTVRLSVLRGLSAAFTNELISIGKMPSDALDDAGVMTVIKREAKRRKDAIEQYTTGGRADLAEDEQKELLILEEFLPAKMEESVLRAFLKEKVTAAGEIGKTKLGQFTGMLIKELGDQADGQTVKKIVDELVA